MEAPVWEVLKLQPSNKVWFTSWVPKTTLSLRQLYRAFICENIISVVQVKVDPSWLFIALTEWWNVQISLTCLVFLSHLIKVGFVKLIFTSLIKFLNPKSRHFVTLATLRIISVRQAKLSSLPGLPYIQRQDNLPTWVLYPSPSSQDPPETREMVHKANQTV